MKRVRVTVGGKVLAEVDVDRELTIGRKAPAEIVVADTEVSSRHAKIRPDPASGSLFVSDLGSTNGTTLDGGLKLPANEEVLFERGQKLAVGPALIEILDSDHPESSIGFASTERTVAISGGMMQSALVNIARFKAAQPRLVIAAEHDRRVVPITEMEVTIGRDGKQAQLVIQHQSVSSKHAKIRFENGRFLVEDLKSVNGTFLDGNPVAVATPVQSDQALTFGTVDCLFVHRAPETGTSGQQDPFADALCAHVVRLGKATRQQADEVLATHRREGSPVGQLFVERGILAPKDWAEIHRQRSIIGTLAPVTARPRMRFATVLGIIVVVLGLAALAVYFLQGK